MNDRFGLPGTTRLLLWAAALLFILNFYMFVAARPAPAPAVDGENEALAELVVPPAHRHHRCRVRTRIETVAPESIRRRDVNRAIAVERERLRKMTERFASPELRINVKSSASGQTAVAITDN